MILSPCSSSHPSSVLSLSSVLALHPSSRLPFPPPFIYSYPLPPIPISLRFLTQTPTRYPLPRRPPSLHPPLPASRLPPPISALPAPARPILPFYLSPLSSTLYPLPPLALAARREEGCAFQPPHPHPTPPHHHPPPLRFPPLTRPLSPHLLSFLLVLSLLASSILTSRLSPLASLPPPSPSALCRSAVSRLAHCAMLPDTCPWPRWFRSSRIELWGYMLHCMVTPCSQKAAWPGIGLGLRGA